MSDLSSRPSPPAADTSPYTYRHRFTASAAESVRLALLRLDRSAVLGLAVIGALALVVTVLLVRGGAPSTVSYSGDGSPLTTAVPSESSAVAPTAESAPSESGTVVVDVAGRVHRPGLVTVPTGSRVWDVVEAAGGFRRPKDSVSLNLARVVADGEQVVVGLEVPGGSGAMSTDTDTGSAGAAEAGAPVNLNTADLAALDTLPGVGPVLAQRILDHRDTNGPFRSIDELNDVSGIGEITFADLAPRVSV
jgi:competence protein ComEA